MSIKNISVVGASGNLGALVLPDLLKSSLNVTVVTRETSSATFPEGIKVAKSDFSLRSLTEVFKGQDAVISMLPILALGDQGIIIEAAIAAGVKRFVPSEYGSDSTNEAVNAAIPFLEHKRKHLEYLKSREDVISWTALFTGPFFDSIWFTGFTGIDLPSKTMTLVDEGKTRFTTCSVMQISRSLVAILTHAQETANRLVYVESFTTTQLEVLAAVEKVTGTKWAVINKKSEDIRAEGLKAMEDGRVMEGGASVIMAAVLGKEALEDHSIVKGGLWNDRLGLPRQSVEEEVKRILQNY